MSLTVVFNDENAIGSGPNPEVRNAYNIPEAHALLPETPAWMNGIAKAAWGHFRFHAKDPSGSQWQLLMYKKGGFFIPHYDDTRRYSFNGVNYLYRHRPEWSLTVLVYLNDDYEGGAINFPNIVDAHGNRLRIQPKAGDVIAFPSHEVFKHHVEPVTSGTRYVLSRWYDDTEWFKSYGSLNKSLRGGVEASLVECPSIAGSTGVAGSPHFFVPDTENDQLSMDKTAQLIDPGIRRVWNVLQDSRICHQHALVRCYWQVQRHGLDSKPQRSSTNRNHFVTMIYAMPRWEQEWGGEIIFFNAQRAVSRAFLPAPWAIIQFRGDQLHALRAPTRDCPDVHKVLVFESRRIYEIKPEDRPADFLRSEG